MSCPAPANSPWQGNTVLSLVLCTSRKGGLFEETKIPVETVIVKDLIAHVDSTYRTTLNSRSRKA